MRSLGRARIVIWEGACLWVAEANRGFAEPGWHAHHAIQLTFLLEGEAEMSTVEERLASPAIGIDADLRHSLAIRGSAAILFIEPESRPGVALRSRLFAAQRFRALPISGLEPVLEALAQAWKDNAPRATFEGLGKSLLAQVSGGADVRGPDERVLRLLGEIGRRIDGPVSIEDVRHGINLSSSRLRHLFAEQTGLAFKTYVLWRRLMRAVELMAEGASPTEAAHEAGFADSAHFSRTFRRTFGMPATTLDVI